MCSREKRNVWFCVSPFKYFVILTYCRLHFLQLYLCIYCFPLTFLLLQLFTSHFLHLLYPKPTKKHYEHSYQRLAHHPRSLLGLIPYVKQTYQCLPFSEVNKLARMVGHICANLNFTRDWEVVLKPKSTLILRGTIPLFTIVRKNVNHGSRDFSQ